MNKKTKQNQPKMISQSVLLNEYHFTKKQIEHYLPPPKLLKNPRYRSAAPMRLWQESEVLKVLESNPDLSRAIRKKHDKKEEKRNRAYQRAREADAYLNQFSPEDLLEQGRELPRHFVLHVGPTNSGKTYEAIRALKNAKTGIYLGPLRLLALEIFETLNRDGVPCHLLTGEEYEEVPGASKTASTIELCDFEKEYDVAVIDEAQLIDDPFRGAAWTNATCLLKAREVHICMASEAASLIIRMLEAMGMDYIVKEHERLVPLEYRGMIRDLKEVRPGDALIAFSRKKVLAIAATLEKEGIKASVIYGALPPAARREETRRFAMKETTVVVATDAIGMGISLPIQRIVFVETEKFDGKEVRKLNVPEIKQIAGRAGRFGQYPLGEVVTMRDGKLIQGGLMETVPPLEKIQLAFPMEALEYDYPLDKLLQQWDRLPQSSVFQRESVREASYLLEVLGKTASHFPKDLLYSLITCPVDIRNRGLVLYWLQCVVRIDGGEYPVKPAFPETTLEECEFKYQAYDIYHQLLRKIGIEDDCLEDKERLCGRINHFLLQKKSRYALTCRDCGCELPLHAKYPICENCYEKRQHYYRNFRN